MADHPGPKSATKGKSHSGESHPLLNLDPRFKPSPEDITVGGNNFAAADAAFKNQHQAHGEGGAYGYMEAMKLEEAAVSMTFYNAIWSKIDHLMYFPDEIAKMRIYGRTSIHLMVNHKGQMVGDILKIESDHRVLKTLATIIAMRGLKSELPKTLWREDQKTTPLILTFDFRTVTIDGPVDDDHGGAFKNGLLFRRTRFIDPALNEHLVYIYTNYIPPIIPFPGGFYIDFIRAYQMIDNYANERPDFYEQRHQQYELLKDQIDSTLKKERAQILPAEKPLDRS